VARRRAAFVVCRPGYKDGTDAIDAVLTMLAAVKAGVDLQPVAADIRVSWSLDHATDERLKDHRRLLSEAARLCSGVVSIDSVNAADFDGVVLPGGEGYLNVYTNFRTTGVACKVEPSLGEFLVDAHGRGVPIASVGVSGLLVVRAVGSTGEVAPSLTVGPDAEVAGAVERLGAVHVSVRPEEAVVDEVNRLVSTAGSASEASLEEVYSGITSMINGMIEIGSTIPAPVREETR
jgi:enhancing lycopene biosynthesis protein 2